MLKYLIFTLAILSSSVALGQEKIDSHVYGLPTTSNDLHWNRWTTRNFTILSLDDKQAQYLVKNVEHIKTWIYTRWGFPDLKFQAECRLICVPNKEIQKNFFNLSESKSEVRYDKNGHPVLYVIYYVLDDKPSKVLIDPLTEICLKNLDDVYGINTPHSIVTGIKLLNKTIPEIRAAFKELHNSPKMFYSKSLLNDDFHKDLSKADRRIYDLSSMSFVFMLRKSFGQSSLHNVMKMRDISILKFGSAHAFDMAFWEYNRNLHSQEYSDSFFQILGD